MLAPNTLLQNRYLIIRRLGKGGMGAVYLAKDQRFGSTVALKQTLLTTEPHRKAFEREARLLNKLRHAALPVVMDYFSEGEGQFLVMQFIPGQDLGELLEINHDAPFAPEQVLQWANELLDALDYLHAHQPPIVHRDIKPQNLKLTPRGEVILLDFGLAKGAAPEMSQASRSVRGYTPSYAPLEQIHGTGTDPRSDLYALAATLYHLLTGRIPPPAPARAAATLSGRPDPLRPAHELNPRVPAGVAAVLYRAMAQNPDERPATAMTMKRMLHAAGQFSRPLNIEAPTLGFESPSAGELALPPTEGPGFLAPQPAPPLIEPQVEAVRQTTQPDTAFKPQTKDGAPPVALPSFRKTLTISLAAGVLVLFLGALFAYRFWNPARATGENKAVTSMPARVEVMRYYLELESADGDSSRVTGVEPIAVGQQFRFHFVPPERGYLYIVAQGAGNVLTTYLTSQPRPGSCITTNLIGAEADYMFPPAQCKGLELGERGETTIFTIIFSPTPVTTPSFLATQAERKLTAAEQQEFEQFLQQSGAKAAKREMNTVNHQASVTVTVPADQAKGRVAVFDVPIKRR